MNNEIIAKSFANNEDMTLGAHYITLVSDKITYENPTGKFVLTYATPNAPISPFDKTLPKKSTANIINKGINVNTITASNYLFATVPKHYFYIEKIIIKPNTVPCGKGGIGKCKPEAIIKRKEYKKGQKFVVINAATDVNIPCIIGVV